MHMTIRFAKDPVKKPAGLIFYMKGYKDSTPVACDEHLTDSGHIYKMFRSIGTEYYMADDIEWLGEDYKDKNATVVLISNANDDLMLPIKFTCDVICQGKILPHRINQHKHFNMIVEFFNFQRGEVNMLEKHERKIAVGNNPHEEAYKSADYFIPWSNAFKMAKMRSSPSAKTVELDMTLKVRVPRDSDALLGTYFDYLLNDSKKTVQALITDLVAKDIAKAKKYVALAKGDEKFQQSVIKMIRDDHEKESGALKRKCEAQEREIEQLKQMISNN